MKEMRDQLRTWDATEWRIARFFPYETGAYRNDIICRSCEDENIDDDINSTLTETFDALVKRVEKILGRRAMDNKIAIEAVNRETGEHIFFGFYDYYYYAATALRPREGWCREPIEIEEA
jgi:hypothetical protein